MNSSTLTGLAAVLFGCGLIALIAAIFRSSDAHGGVLVWVGLGLPPGNNHSKGSIDDLNRLGASVGAMAQANADQGVEGIAASDFRTMNALGKRVAEAAQRWREQPLAKAA